jgi:hypothetical protein
MGKMFSLRLEKEGGGKGSLLLSRLCLEDGTFYMGEGGLLAS